MSISQIRCQLFLFGLIILLFSGCHPEKGKNASDASTNDQKTEGAKNPTELRKVTFMPYWVTTAQFAGYYVAEEKGIYERYELKVDIIPFKPFITSTELIREKKADFAALWLVNAIELKAGGVDVVNIAQPSFRSSAMLLTKKKSGINTVEKMNGKKAGIWSGFELQPYTFFNKYNLQVEIVPIGSSNNLFLMDGVDITIANWFDEYHSIINSGYDPDELNVFFFADHGLNFLEDGIYCLSDKLKKDPGLCADFVKATLEGWKYAFDHREEAIDIVLKRAKEDKVPTNRVHQEWMIDRYQDLYLPEGKTEFNNSLSAKDYQFVGKILKENNLIDEIPPFDQFYQPVIKN
ncbi:MAG TPA: ABC transporter substrate-binding protein [Prolixibacteraceae bacterium]|nr:ABC transporter substrate-binding protein [Prolixibacteraceae bacterium]